MVLGTVVEFDYTGVSDIRHPQKGGRLSVTKNSILILPGLDGTDRMLAEFQSMGGDKIAVKVLTLPDDRSLDYHGLAEHFRPVIQAHVGCHVVAQSFSGQIGILVAHKFPQCVSRLTLVASFASSPVSRIASCLPWSLLFRLRLPSFVEKYFFVGQTTSLIPQLRSAIKQNSPAVLLHRFRILQKANVLVELAELECPLDYVQATHDRLLPRRCLKEIRKVRPDTVVHEIEGPHLILQTQAKLAWRKIVEDTTG